jgi:hypothetical protein
MRRRRRKGEKDERSARGEEEMEEDKEITLLDTLSGFLCNCIRRTAASVFLWRPSVVKKLRHSFQGKLSST